jgi:hypothetical protein
METAMVKITIWFILSTVCGVVSAGLHHFGYGTGSIVLMAFALLFMLFHIGSEN